jgi:hypothetical protein
MADPSDPPCDPTAVPSGQRHFRVCWPALAATAVSLGGYSLCSYSEKSSIPLVGLGLFLAFSGFIGVSLAMILDSDLRES